MSEPSNTHGILRRLATSIKCKPGWHFVIVSDGVFLRLRVRVDGFDSSVPNDEMPLSISHFFPVPEATYNEATWRRWIFDCCVSIEMHELGEWFRVDGKRPYEPCHGPGENPYVFHEYRPAIDALTTQDGSIRKPYED